MVRVGGGTIVDCPARQDPVAGLHRCLVGQPRPCTGRGDGAGQLRHGHLLAAYLALEKAGLLKLIELDAHRIGRITKLLGEPAQMTLSVGMREELEQELKAGLAGD